MMSVPTAETIKKIQPQKRVKQVSSVPTSLELIGQPRSIAPTSHTMPYEASPVPVDYEEEFLRNCYGKFFDIDEL